MSFALPLPALFEHAPLNVDRNLTFHHPANQAALAFWQARRRDREMPARADLDPVEMRGFLPHVVLLDVLPRPSRPAGYRVRVAGAVIEEVYGAVTGKIVGEVLPPDIAARWSELFVAAIDARAPIRATTRVAHEPADYLMVEAFVAPLSENGRDVSMIFASAAFWSETPPPAGQKSVKAAQGPGRRS